MAVGFVGYLQLDGASGYNADITVPSGTDFMVVVANGWRNTAAPTVSACTYDGDALTLLDTITYVTGGNVNYMYGLAVSPGTANFTMTFSSAWTEGGGITIAFLSGVDSASPVVDKKWERHTAGNDATWDISLTSVADGMGVGFVGGYGQYYETMDVVKTGTYDQTDVFSTVVYNLDRYKLCYKASTSTTLGMGASTSGFGRYTNFHGVTLRPAAGGVTVSPTAASAVAAVVAPVVGLGSVTVTAGAVGAVGAVATPAVVLGAVTLTPGAAGAVGAVVGPGVELGDVTFSPAPAAVVGAVAGPSVVLGDLVVTPGAAGAIGGVAGPSVDTGGAITFSPAPAGAVAAVGQPVVELGDLVISPAAAAAIAGRAGPTVELGDLVISPAAAAAIAAIVAPAVADSFSFSPGPAGAVGAVAGPAVVLGSLVFQPAPAVAVAGVDGPIVLGSVSLIVPGVELRIRGVRPHFEIDGTRIHFAVDGVRPHFRVRE